MVVVTALLEVLMTRTLELLSGTYRKLPFGVIPECITLPSDEMVAATVFAAPPPPPGPAVPLMSVTESAVTLARTVPSPQPVAVTVNVVPGCVPVTENEQPAAVPAFVMSLPVRPVIDSLNDSPKVWVVLLVGLADADVHVATGAPGTGSTAVVVAVVTLAAGPALPAESEMLLARRRAMRVPAEHPVTVTVMAVPDAVAGVNTQSIAVPVFTKSAAASPVMFSFAVSVYVPLVEMDAPGVAVNEAVGAVRSMVMDADGAAPEPLTTVTVPGE